MAEHMTVLWTLAAGLAGAAALTVLGMPAGALIGAGVAVAVSGALTGQVAVPGPLRDAGFMLIGMSMGSGVDPRFGAYVADWALSLSLLVVSLCVTLFVGAAILRKFFGFDRQSAFLATAPGTLSNVIALAIENRGDVAAITTLQVLRLMVLVLTAPLLADLFDTVPVALSPPAPTAAIPLALMFLASYALGRGGQRIGIPAASLLAGLLTSGTGHVTGLVHGAVPPWLVFVALTLTGAFVGTRITRIRPAALQRLVGAGSAVLAAMLGVSLLFAVLTMILSGLPFAQVWIAFAPGGVEAMTAIGLSLGLDPAYVAIHHFVRILALIVIVPMVLHGPGIRPPGGRS